MKKSAKSILSTDNTTRLILFILFFFSGASALIYQVIWVRMFGLVFGITVFAASTVLSAFMAGLALGSLYFGRYADRHKNPVKLFACLQISIGVFALLFPFILSGLTELYLLLHRYLYASFYLFSLVRFLLAFLLLLIPTTLMGGTLPVLSKFFVKKLKELGWNIGSLYSVNNLGAVIGCLLAGFLLIKTIGVRQTLYLAAIINILIGAISLAVSKSVDTGKDAENETLAEVETLSLETTPPYPKHILYLVLWVFAIEGFVSLAYEVLWMRILVLFLDNTTYNFSIIVTSFISGLSLGSFWMAKIVDKKKNLLTLLGFIEICIGLSAILILLLFGALLSFDWFRFYFIFAPRQQAVGNYIFFSYIYSFLVMLVPSFLMGTTFPLVGRIYARSLKNVGRYIGNLGCLDSVGAIVGSFIAGFIFIPMIGLQKSIFLIAFINITLGGIIIIAHPSASRKSKYGILSIVLIFLAVIASIYHNINFYSLQPGEKLLYYKEGAYATVTVVEKNDSIKILKLNNIEEVPTDYASLQTFHMLGHLPNLLHKNPQKALVICFGGGITTGAVATHDLEQIDAVEISPEMVKASNYFLEENQNVLSDPKVNLIIEDARNYLLTTKNRYDVIICDATHPASSDSWMLYTKEFYESCEKILNEGGIICQWLPLHSLVPRDYKIILKTFQSVFPHTSLWLPTGYSLMLGANEKLEIDFDLFTKKLEDKTIKEDLEVLHLDDPFAFLSRFIMGEATVDFTKDSPINTDNNTPIQFAWEGQKGVATIPLNMRELEEFRQSAFPLLVNTGKDTDNIKEKLKTYFESKEHEILGQIFTQESRIGDMLRQYRKALNVNPEDKSIQFLFDAGKQRYLGEGGFYQKEGRHEEAIKIYKEILEIDPQCVQALSQMGSAYLELGKYEQAITIIKQALAIEPDLAMAHNNLGVVYRYQGLDDNAAIEAFQKAIEIEPTYLAPYYNLADIYYKTGKVEEAIDLLQTAIKIGPAYPNFHYNLAKMYFQTGMLDKAINELNMAIKLNPQWVEARYGLAVAYINAGRYQDAKLELKKILKINPDFQLARKTLRDLGR